MTRRRTWSKPVLHACRGQGSEIFGTDLLCSQLLRLLPKFSAEVFAEPADETCLVFDVLNEHAQDSDAAAAPLTVAAHIGPVAAALLVVWSVDFDDHGAAVANDQEVGGHRYAGPLVGAGKRNYREGPVLGARLLYRLEAAVDLKFLAGAEH